MPSVVWLCSGHWCYAPHVAVCRHFDELQFVEDYPDVILGYNSHLKTTGVGRIRTSCGYLKGVLLIPNLSQNLLFVPSAEGNYNTLGLKACSHSILDHIYESSRSINQSAIVSTIEETCLICQTLLKDLPVRRLECGHVFLRQCVKKNWQKLAFVVNSKGLRCFYDGNVPYPSKGCKITYKCADVPAFGQSHSQSGPSRTAAIVDPASWQAQLPRLLANRAKVQKLHAKVQQKIDSMTKVISEHSRKTDFRPVCESEVEKLPD